MAQFLKRMMDLPTKNKEIAADLVRRGYRRTSWKHRMVSRVDRPDWQLGANMAGIVRTSSQGSAADFYRRVYSKDVLIVSREVIGLIPTSGHDPVGYVDPDSVN